jgi:hypothetical protein
VPKILAAVLRYLAVVACLLVGAPCAVAQTIVGCVSHAGRLRIVDDVTRCRASERPLEWNQAGTAGPRGEPGLPGPVGPRGPSPVYF